LPRYRSIVRAFAGDSTITRFLGIAREYSHGQFALRHLTVDRDFTPRGGSDWAGGHLEVVICSVSVH
jgi:hypothetical protein